MFSIYLMFIFINSIVNDLVELMGWLIIYRYMRIQYEKKNINLSTYILQIFIEIYDKN